VVARNSLSSREDFRRVFAQGSRARHGGVTVVGVRSSAAEGASRVGLVVPGAVGTAVVRNRIRRRTRAALAEARPVSGFDIVVRADVRAGEAEFQQLVGDLKRALSGAGIECAE
jgi:ribonuclease P protein component